MERCCLDENALKYPLTFVTSRQTLVKFHGVDIAMMLDAAAWPKTIQDCCIINTSILGRVGITIVVAVCQISRR